MENQNGKTKVFIKYLCVATIAGVLFTVNIVLKFQAISRSNSCKCSTTVHLYEIKPCLLSLIQRYDTFNVLPADGTDGLRQGLIAAETAAHVSTVQQHAASWVTQAYHTHVLRYVHAVLLLLSSFSCTHQFKLPPHVLLLPPQLQLAIVPASRPHQHSHTCQRTNTRQHPPHRRLPFLLQPQGLKVVRAQEVLWAVGGWADLWEAVCVQDELSPLQSKTRPLSASPLFQVDLWASLRSGTDRSGPWSRNWPGGTSHGQFPFWDPWPPGDRAHAQMPCSHPAG